MGRDRSSCGVPKTHHDCGDLRFRLWVPSWSSTSCDLGRIRVSTRPADHDVRSDAGMAMQVVVVTSVGPNQEHELSYAVAQVHQDVACLLGHQAPLGLAVTPRRWTRRVACSTTNNTYNRCDSSVSTQTTASTPAKPTIRSRLSVDQQRPPTKRQLARFRIDHTDCWACAGPATRRVGMGCRGAGAGARPPAAGLHD